MDRLAIPFLAKYLQTPNRQSTFITPCRDVAISNFQNGRQPPSSMWYSRK